VKDLTPNRQVSASKPIHILVAASAPAEALIGALNPSSIGRRQAQSARSRHTGGPQCVHGCRQPPRDDFVVCIDKGQNVAARFRSTDVSHGGHACILQRDDPGTHPGGNIPRAVCGTAVHHYRFHLPISLSFPFDAAQALRQTCRVIAHRDDEGNQW
jgi:hypothetical protein